MSFTIWFKPKEAKDYAKVTVATLRRAVRAGRLAAFKINGNKHIRFRQQDLDAWLSASPINDGTAAS